MLRLDDFFLPGCAGLDQDRILDELPWAREMAATPQDPRHHAEGDGWTHTVMVCQALTRAEAWPDLTLSESG